MPEVSVAVPAIGGLVAKGLARSVVRVTLGTERSMVRVRVLLVP